MIEKQEESGNHEQLTFQIKLLTVLSNKLKTVFNIKFLRFLLNKVNKSLIEENKIL